MRRLLFFIYAFILIPSTFAYQWPNPQTQVKAHFAQFLPAGISRALLLGGEFEDIYPVSEGKVVFQHSATDKIFPTKRATTLITSHEDGVSVIYEGVGELLLDKESKTLSTEQPFGKKLPETNFQVGFYDIQTSQYVNPLIFLPDLMKQNKSRLDNKQSPTVLTFSLLYLKNQKTGQEYQMNQADNTLPRGVYEVIAEVKEVVDNIPLAPYQIDFDYMGNLMVQLTLDALTAQDGQGVIKGKKVYNESDLYDSKGRFRLGQMTLTPGHSFMRLKISGIRASDRQKEFRVLVE